jgi:hypothetical protein
MGIYRVKRTLIGQLEKGSDLYNSITRIIHENHIRVGRVTGMGALQRARLAYYDQKTMKYSEIVFAEPMEIVSLYGNISMKDGKSFAHVHVVLSDEKGNGKGGHLLPGEAPVFACEIVIEEFDGPDLVRTVDENTGLALWAAEKNL